MFHEREYVRIAHLYRIRLFEFSKQFQGKYYAIHVFQMLLCRAFKVIALEVSYDAMRDHPTDNCAC